MTSFRKILLYVILTVVSYFAMSLAFREYLKPVARGILYMGERSTVSFVWYMPFLGVVGLFSVPFIKKKKSLLIASLLFQLAPFFFLIYSRDFDNFSNPSFYVPAFLYLTFATLTTIAIFQDNSIPEQRIRFQR